MFLAQRENNRKTIDLAILHRATLEIGKKNNTAEVANTTLEILQKRKTGVYGSAV